MWKKPIVKNIDCSNCECKKTIRKIKKYFIKLEDDIINENYDNDLLFQISKIKELLNEID